MSSDEIKQYKSICRYNTGCKFETCKFQHAMPFNLRLKMIEIAEANPEIREKYGKEDFPLIRIAPCKFGQLCIKEECTFKHGLTHEGRKEMSRLFRASKPYGKK